MKDIEQSIKLDDGKSFEGLFDPSKDVSASENEQGWQRYKFRFLADDLRMVNISGGTRLFDEMMRVCGTNEAPVRLRITAKGPPGNKDRTYVVEKIPPRK